MDFDQEYLRSKVMKSGDDTLELRVDSDGVARYYIPEEEPMLPEVVVEEPREMFVVPAATAAQAPKPKAKPVAAMPTQGQLDLGEASLIKPTGAMGVLKSVGEMIQSGADKIDFDVLGLPGIGTLTLKDLTVGDLGKVLVDIAEGFPPVTGSGQTLSPTMEAAELINVAPATAGAVKIGKKVLPKVAESLAPTIGKMAEDYLTKTGALLKVAPDAPAIEVPTAPKLNTPAFKNWFGNSKIVDDKGAPIVMYHGTKHQFEKFDPKIGYQGAMFFSPKREFAENYMGGTDVREPIAVYISAKNPFDYDNPKHRQAVIELAIENTPIYKNAPDQAGMRRVLEDALTSKDSNWTTIEDTGFQNAIKKLGFDSFYVKESGVKNIGVYDPTQIKSVFNKGTFNPKDPRILYGGGVAGTGTMQQQEKK